MESLGRIFTIELFGQKHSFEADAEDAQIEKIVRYVVDQVEKAKASGEMPSKLDSVILAALNIASDYFKIKQGQQALLDDLDRRCKALVKRIDHSL